MCAVLDALPVARVGAGTTVLLCNVWPWAVAETNAARPPVNPAAPAISQRRARPMRASAASRCRAAFERESGAIWCRLTISSLFVNGIRFP
jgi:hypothetical protein